MPADTLIAGVALSHPARLIYPELQFTKLDLALFYEAIAEWILPHVKGRPLTLVHCPDGMAGDCRYLRHANVWGPRVLRRVRIREKTKLGEYLVADDIAGVVGLIQMGVVEIHTWNSLADDVEHPNRIVWDLDPGPEVGWSDVVAAARVVRDVLGSLGLETWVKTTGGRGLHIVAPVQPQRDWSECLAFSRAIAQAIVRSDPATYTVRFAKQGRDRQILIDYLRNNRTNTSICGYSSRARREATVSVPMSWRELTSALRPARFTVQSVPQRLRRRADPWRDYWTCRQRITPAMVRAIGSAELPRDMR